MHHTARNYIRVAGPLAFWYATLKSWKWTDNYRIKAIKDQIMYYARSVHNIAKHQGIRYFMYIEYYQIKESGNVILSYVPLHNTHLYAFMP